MMNLYVDMGRKAGGARDMVTVCAVAFRQTPYARFVREWRRFLRGWGASCFHATDFYPGANEFQRTTLERRALHAADSKRLPDLIGPYFRHAWTISIDHNEFKAKAPLKWTKEGQSVHSVAAQFVLEMIGAWALHQSYFNGFAFVMESGDEYGGEVRETVERMRSNVSTRDLVQLRSVTVADKGTACGLEAADFIAWHWNKYYLDKVVTNQTENPRKDFAALMLGYGRNVTPGMPTGAEMDRFFKEGEAFYMKPQFTAAKWKPFR